LANVGPLPPTWSWHPLGEELRQERDRVLDDRDGEAFERDSRICRKGGSIRDQWIGLGIPNWSRRACWERIAEILGECLMECARKDGKTNKDQK